MIRKIRAKHLIDFTYVVLLILLGFLIVKFLFRSTEYKIITVRIGQEYIRQLTPVGVMPEIIEQLRPGKIEKDTFGRLTSEILQVDTYPVDIYSQIAVVKLKVKAIYSSSSRSYVYNSRPLLVGSQIRLAPENVLIEGIITSIQDSDNANKYKKILVKGQLIREDPSMPYTKGVMPFLSESIHIGDEIKTSSGETILRIIDIRSENAKLYGGDSSNIASTLLRDVYISMEIQATKKGNHYYLYDLFMISVGEFFPIRLGTVSAYVLTTNIYETE